MTSAVCNQLSPSPERWFLPRMVLEEDCKIETALWLVIHDRDAPARFQIFFNIAEIVRRSRQMMKHIPGEHKIETGFRQIHLASLSKDSADIFKPFLCRLASDEIKILRLHVNRIDPPRPSRFPGKGKRKISASGTDVGYDIAVANVQARDDLDRFAFR